MGECKKRRSSTASIRWIVEDSSKTALRNLAAHQLWSLVQPNRRPQLGIQLMKLSPTTTMPAVCPALRNTSEASTRVARHSLQLWESIPLQPVMTVHGFGHRQGFARMLDRLQRSLRNMAETLLCSQQPKPNGRSKLGRSLLGSARDPSAHGNAIRCHGPSPLKGAR